MKNKKIIFAVIFIILLSVGTLYFTGTMQQFYSFDDGITKLVGSEGTTLYPCYFSGASLGQPSWTRVNNNPIEIE